MPFRTEAALLALAVSGVLSELACTLTGHPAPGLFQEVTLAAMAGAAGIAVPGRQSTPADPAPADPAPAPAAAAQADPNTYRGPGA